METRPSLSIYGDQPFSTLSKWTVADVEAAIKAFEQGMFRDAALLWDAMMREDRIMAVINTRVQGLLGLPFSFTDGTDKRRSSAISRVAQDAWPRMFPDSSVKTALITALGMGVVACELVWNTSGSPWTFTLRPWPAQFLEYRWTTRSYWIYTMEGPIEIVRGDGKWLLLEFGEPYAWMTGLVRTLAIPYLVRSFTLRDWANYSEVHGSPIKKVFVPDDAEEVEKDGFFRRVREMARNGTVKLPRPSDGTKSWDVELLEATSQTWMGFEHLRQQAATDIAVTVLGQNLTTEVRGGSMAAANVHERVRLDVLEADAGILSNNLIRDVFRPWAAYNYGNPELAPTPTWDATPPADRNQDALTLGSLASALPILESAGVDIPALLEGYGIPLLPLGQRPAKAQALPALEPTPTGGD